MAAAGPSFADDAAAGAPPSPSAAFWAGGAVKSRVVAGYLGGIWAANGSLDADGIQLRGEYVYVSYNTHSALSSSGNAHGTLNRGNAEVGYQLVRYGIASSLFVGPDYQDFSVSPPVARNSGLTDKIGAMFLGRVARAGTQQIPASLEGNYSTANSTYWARGRVGYNFGQFAVGPEIGYLGNAAFDEARYGGYTSISLSQSAVLQASVGWSHELRTNIPAANGGEGGYAELSFVLLNY
jgi:hypothetical protein